MINLIGLMGIGGAGKSSVARVLRERHGFITPHIKSPFADMQRTLLRDHLGYDDAMCDRYIDGDLKRAVIPELGVTSTDVQQSLGTEWGRKCIRPTIWIDIWCLKVDETLLHNGAVALESCRFSEEASAIRERGGLLIEVRRPGTTAVNGHVSEQIPAEPDRILNNDGTLDALSGKVAALLC